MKTLILKRIIFALFAILFFSLTSYAQEGGGSGRPHQIGAFMGKVLPKNIDGADEIFTLTGVRWSMPVGSSNGFVDFGTLFGNSEGVKWQAASLTLSMQVPIETLIGHAGLGVDFTRYETDTTTTRNSGGVHFLGGILNRIGGNVLARFDMKLNSKPGTSLFFGLGITIELGGAGSN